MYSNMFVTMTVLLYLTCLLPLGILAAQYEPVKSKIHPKVKNFE